MSVLRHRHVIGFLCTVRGTPLHLDGFQHGRGEVGLDIVIRPRHDTGRRPRPRPAASRLLWWGCGEEDRRGGGRLHLRCRGLAWARGKTAAAERYLPPHAYRRPSQHARRRPRQKRGPSSGGGGGRNAIVVLLYRTCRARLAFPQSNPMTWTKASSPTCGGVTAGRGRGEGGAGERVTFGRRARRQTPPSRRFSFFSSSLVLLFLVFVAFGGRLVWVGRP